MPAAWVSWAPAKRRELSRSAGTPSSWELEVESWSTVAKGFDRDESCSVSGAIVKIGGRQAVGVKDMPRDNGGSPNRSSVKSVAQQQDPD